MKPIYDKDGNQIPASEIAILACQALSEVKRERTKELAQHIMDFANKRAIEKKMFGLADAYMIVSIVKNHDNTYPFSGA